MQSWISGPANGLDQWGSATGVLGRRKVVTRLTLAKDFGEVIGGDQPSVIGTRTLSVDAITFSSFVPKNETFLFVADTFCSP